MRYIISVIFAIACFAVLQPTVQAAPKAGKANKAYKERLVLLPIVVSAEIRNMQSSMETSVIQGLEKKYVVYSGERVMQELKKASIKENARAKKDCDETRCLEEVAMAFQTENFAKVDVTKIEGGYLLSLKIQDIASNESIYSNSLTCRKCDSFEVVDRLKELGGAAIATAEPVQDESIASVNKNDPESALWNEVQKGNSVDDYGAYIAQYPKGKYVALAKSRSKKLQEQEAAEARKQQAEAAAEAAQQEQGAWEGANSTASVASYTEYLNSYPGGQYAGLATARIAKLKKEAVILAAQAPKLVNANKATKERLVLMPLRVPDEDKSLAVTMEAALVEGMQSKYEVISGEQVAQQARASFRKDSERPNQKYADETRVMQEIAASFQAELIATANVSKQSGGYFLALSVQNIFDNKVVYSKTAVCEYCSAIKVIEKLKELGGTGPVLPAR